MLFKRKRLDAPAVIAVAFFSFSPLAAETVAVGFFDKQGTGLELELLQYEIPQSLMNRLKKKDDGLDFKSPEEQQIAFGRSLGSTGNYSPEVIQRIQKTFGADYFVTGRVASLDDGLNIRTTVYSKDKKISISMTARTPAGLDRALDKITDWVYGRIQDKQDLVAGNLRKGSRVGFITNLDPVQQNFITIFFARAGFLVSSVGQNEGRAPVEPYVQAFETLKAGDSEVGPGAFVPNLDPDHPELQNVDAGYSQWYFTDEQKEAQRTAVLEKRAEIERNTGTALTGFGRTYNLDYLVVLYLDRTDGRDFCRIIDIKANTIIYFNDRQDIPGDEMEPDSWQEFSEGLLNTLVPAKTKGSGEKK